MAGWPARRCKIAKPAPLREPVGTMEVYFDSLTSPNVRLDRLAEEIEALAQDAEAVLRHSGDLPPAERERLAERLARLRTTAGAIKQQALRGLRATDRVIRAHPYEAMGVALLAGLVAGLLLGRPAARAGANS